MDGFNSAVAWKGFANFVRCTFANNTLHPTDFGAGLIEADVEDEPGGEGSMCLEGCGCLPLMLLITLMQDSLLVPPHGGC